VAEEKHCTDIERLTDERGGGRQRGQEVREVLKKTRTPKRQLGRGGGEGRTGTIDATAGGHWHAPAANEAFVRG
jgi:hypothetical protein